MQTLDFSTKKTTHIVSVRNKIPGISEAKGFSISCEQMTKDSLFEILSEFIRTELPKKLHQEFIIMRAPTRRMTHSIVLISKIENGTSKCISVDYPQHSSVEIARELQKFLCGGVSTF